MTDDQKKTLRAAFNAARASAMELEHLLSQLPDRYDFAESVDNDPDSNEFDKELAMDICCFGENMAELYSGI